jgi:hypothetical protein
VGAEVNEPQDILFGVTAQSFVFDVRDGRPTAVASLAVREDEWDDTQTALTATTGSPSVESVTTTTTVAAGKSQTDRTKITLTSAASFKKNRTYSLVGLTGEFEMVELAKVDTTNNIVYTRTPMLNDFAVGSTLASSRLTCSVDSTWVAAVNYLSDPLSASPRFRLRWQYTAVTGETAVGIGWADLVRSQDLHSVAPGDIDARFPGWLDRLPIDERVGQGARLIRAAWREVGVDLVELGKKSSAQRNSLVLNELVLYKARVLSAEAAFDHGGTAQAQLERATAEYERRLRLLSEPKTNQQLSPDGAGGPSPRVKYWRK